VPLLLKGNSLFAVLISLTAFETTLLCDTTELSGSESHTPLVTIVCSLEPSVYQFNVSYSHL